MGYSLRVNHKKLSTDLSPDRNDQFLYLSDLRRRFQRRGLPIISVDTKKRELVGDFKNPGARWDLSPAPGQRSRFPFRFHRRRHTVRHL